MPRTRYRVLTATHPHFCTATIRHWLPLFARPEVAGIILGSWRFLQQDSGFALYGYVIMENHLHLVARSQDLGLDIQRFKSYSAKRILARLQSQHEEGLLRLLAATGEQRRTGSQYQVWEEGSHPQLIENPAVMVQKLEYIHNNPVRRGYVDLPEHWRYSSARSYAGQEGLIEVVTDW